MNINDKKIVGIIPARGGSKGIPRKNIKPLAGKPLIAYTIEAALKSKYLDRVIVSTEDEEIANVSRKYGAEVPFVRPDSLSGDSVPVVPDIPKYIIKELKKREGFNVDVVVVLQPTSPLRDVKYIDQAIEKLFSTKCDWVVTVSSVNIHPFRMRKMKKDRLEPLFANKNIWAQRQDLPPVYHFNGAIYVTKKSVITTKNVFKNKDWRGIIMEPEEAIDIDTMADFIAAENILKIKNAK
jgi:N-acylneuraminate cytidylyltransferase/CMP-N,N'-diacetyllegionaminic acid synthase